MICLREPSLGPCFGVKGGAAGGGYAQVLPMEDINLHFTGDFHAIGVANNLLAAMVDNHIYSGNSLGSGRAADFVAPRHGHERPRVCGRLAIAFGGVGNGFPRQDGFDIIAASEVMAVFCLAEDLADLKRRLGNIIVGQTRDKKYVRAVDLQACRRDGGSLEGCVCAESRSDHRRKSRLRPWRAFCEHRARLQFRRRDKGSAEAGGLCCDGGRFRRRSGREKFLDIKCRKAGLKPDCAVIVATIRALKMHGGVAEGGSRKRERRGSGKGLRQSRPSHRKRPEVWSSRDGLHQSIQRGHAGRDGGAEGVVREA